MGLREFLDPPGQQLALVKDGSQRGGQARDDQRGPSVPGTVTVCSSGRGTDWRPGWPRGQVVVAPDDHLQLGEVMSLVVV